MKNKWSYVALHFAIFMWGAAGVAGRLMTVSAAGIVVYRSLIAAAILLVFNHVRCRYGRASPKNMESGQDTSLARNQVPMREKAYLLLTGVILGLHWLGFFTAIKLSTVSITLVCMASGPIFVAVIQPLIDRTPIKKSQLVLGLLSFSGIAMIFKFEGRYQLGIAIGLLAGAIDAIYSIMASRTNPKISIFYTTQMHMIGAFLIIFGLYSLFEPSWSWLSLKTPVDWIGIGFLGVMCSALSMSLYILSLKSLSAFTATLSLNMEAVYGIVLALIVFGSREYLSWGFYLGAFVLVGCIVLDSILSLAPKKMKPKNLIYG